MSRALRAVAAAALLAGSSGSTAAAASPPAASSLPTGQRSGVLPGPDRIGLLSQSPWVVAKGAFELRLQVSAAHLQTDRLQVVVYPRLTTRTGFGATLAGQVIGPSVYSSGLLALTSLISDPSGGTDVTIPVNQPAPSGGLPEMFVSGGSGVFPLQARLYDQGGLPQGLPLTTYLVYAAGTSVATDFPRLDVSLTIPVDAGTSVDAAGRTKALAAGQADHLARLVSALASYPGVPLDLAVNPQTLDALAEDGPGGRTTLAALGALATHGTDRVLAAPYVDVSLRGLVDAGLVDELARQLAQGRATLASALHVTPAAATWVTAGHLDLATVGALVAGGARQLVLPDADLTQVPFSVRQTTYAQPAELSGGRLPVVGADTGLAVHFTNTGDQVLAADQLLAELAMIQVETPGRTRGVAVLAPPGWYANSTFVSTVLAGLTSNPLLAPVTASQLFRDVPAGRSSQEPIVRSLVSPRGPAAAPGDPNLLREARGQVDAIAAVVPAQTAEISALARQLLVAEAVDVSGRRRVQILSAVSAAFDHLRTLVALPGATSVTLTARQGQVPLAVLSAPSVDARVQLRMSSQKLIFRPFSPPGGHCQVPTPTEEICQLTLRGQNTTLKVPVETRASGVFPFDVTLLSPDGAIVLSHNRDTVRSTAVSSVGVVLIVGAALLLGVWWVRDIRHGRRAHELVPHPGDDEYGSGAAPAIPPSWVEPSDVINEFFDTPPPDLPRPSGFRP